MDTVVFNKEDFKKSVLDNVKNIYRKNIDEVTLISQKIRLAQLMQSLLVLQSFLQQFS